MDKNHRYSNSFFLSSYDYLFSNVIQLKKRCLRPLELQVYEIISRQFP